MTQICLECAAEVSCQNCNNFKPSIHLLGELSKASRVCGQLSEQLEIAKNFIRKIVYDWKCDPNQANAILNELERMNKKDT